MPINPLIGSALIGAVGGLIGQGRQARQTNRNIERTNRANREMADLAYSYDRKLSEYAFDRNQEMWRIQNQYNTPAMQMQRFKEAGLNPNLIYGQGTPGNATGAPTYQPPSYKAPQQDYRGKQDETASILNSITGATSNLLQLKHAKEALDQQEVQTWISQNSKEASVALLEQGSQKAFWEVNKSLWESKISEIKHSFWKDGISPTDATWLRIGYKALESFKAPEWIKKLFKLPPKMEKALQHTIQMK